MNSDGWTAAVLAGGRSRRMGTDKAGLVLPDGRTLLARQIDLLEELNPSALFVSARSGQELPALPRRVQRIDDPGTHGPLGGVVALLRASPYPRVLVLAVDLPRLDRSTLQALLAPDREQLGVLLELRGEPEPFPALYPRSWLRVAELALETGHLALRPLLASSEAREHFRRVTAPAPGALLNWNSPIDYQLGTE